MVDYSKWNNIDVSEDEDDYHPNIDQASLWKWKKEARVLREQEEQREKQRIKEEHEKALKALKEAEEKTKAKADEQSAEQVQAVAGVDLDELRRQEAAFAAKEAEIERKEKLYPKWTSSNICHDAFSKTFKNTAATKRDLTEEEKLEEQRKFFKDHKPEIVVYGNLKSDAESEAYLAEHPYLVSECTANYLVIRAVDLEVEDKHAEMKVVARQTILMQFMLEIAKAGKQPPPVIIKNYFTKARKREAEYMQAFQDELQSLIARIENRANERLEEMVKEYEEEEKQKRIAASPGGLDPQEVMDSLPESMQKAFESRDIQMLQDAIKEMDLETAKYHIERCTKSGLWVPGDD